ncbi:RUN and FYVE domain-containing protein 1 [Cichlidogyrus casuarinus]|uniref:RUN and FYVE domain-containing protein 1 n=1 Tax=Cichlidogyrus casuarinus TaxID=1844966 RepID=A0ABD2QNQ2_9PLAT
MKNCFQRLFLSLELCLCHNLREVFDVSEPFDVLRSANALLRNSLFANKSDPFPKYTGYWNILKLLDNVCPDSKSLLEECEAITPQPSSDLNKSRHFLHRALSNKSLPEYLLALHQEREKLNLYQQKQINEKNGLPVALQPDLTMDTLPLYYSHGFMVNDEAIVLVERLYDLNNIPLDCIELSDNLPLPVFSIDSEYYLQLLCTRFQTDSQPIGMENSSLKERLVECNSIRTQLELSLVELNEKTLQQEREIKIAKMNQATLQKQLNDARKEIESCKSQLIAADQLQAQQVVNQNEIEALNKLKCKYEQSLEEWRMSFRNLSDVSKAKDARLAKLNQALEGKESAINSLDGQVQDLSSQLIQTKQQLREAKENECLSEKSAIELNRMNRYITEEMAKLEADFRAQLELLEAKHKSREAELVAQSSRGQDRENVDKCIATVMTTDTVKKCFIPQPMSKSEWMADEVGKQCSGCLCAFSISRRRHHCRNCGLLFCLDCCSNRFSYPGLDQPPQRVCSDCYHFLLQQRNCE